VARIDTRDAVLPWRRGAVLVALMLLVGCNAPPVQRPREGAPPIGASTPVRLENVLPSTLAPAGNLNPTPTPEPPPPSPPPAVAASPAASPGSPGLYPIVSGLQPAPGATLPAGDVVIGARVTGSSDLTDITAFIDGEAVTIDLEGPPVRVRTVSFVRSFASGTHEIRIQARDDRGQLGGYRWQFSIGAPRQPAAVPEPKPAVAPTPTSPLITRTPLPLPTRRPTIVLTPPTGPTPTRPLPR
jgi:hypothetical protein